LLWLFIILTLYSVFVSFLLMAHLISAPIITCLYYYLPLLLPASIITCLYYYLPLLLNYTSSWLFNSIVGFRETTAEAIV
jgi:hypothetical protein